MEAECEKLKEVVCDTIGLLCQKGLTFYKILKIEGVICVTADDNKFVIHIDQIFDPTSNNPNNIVNGLYNETETSAPSNFIKREPINNSFQQPIKRSFKTEQSDFYSQQQSYQLYNSKTTNSIDNYQHFDLPPVKQMLTQNFASSNYETSGNFISPTGRVKSLKKGTSMVKTSQVKKATNITSSQSTNFNNYGFQQSYDCNIPKTSSVSSQARNINTKANIIKKETFHSNITVRYFLIQYSYTLIIYFIKKCKFDFFFKINKRNQQLALMPALPSTNVHTKANTSINSNNEKELIIVESVHICGYPDCSKRFKYRGDLLKHQTKNHNRIPSRKKKADGGFDMDYESGVSREENEEFVITEATHICGYSNCNKRFKYRGDLLKHQTKNHGRVPKRKKINSVEHGENENSALDYDESGNDYSNYDDVNYEDEEQQYADEIDQTYYQ
ncbi:hypothetical protein HELRODRAFT_172075 [Helobdella robusta]|uniref:C2H2-type domain-containing protein n=1 Tax=Helobdella robusta TaxID=6412 RepID=T1F501_HELRO|nr:hypothetical protein HELRODRAFT_172075 [Helobdella robusta]ESO05060.1 hypothetical protein HELRODRAFT_172075 [Helobdella robusta]